MKFRVTCSVVIAAFAFAATAGAQTTDAINFNTTYQTIRGFGTSTAWQPVLNSTQANNLFGVGAGQVGLTILRSRIDPSSTTGGSNWQTELNNAQQAQSINSQVIVFATPWTPPAVWKSNGSVDDGTLNTSDYDNFANYLNAFIAYEKAGGVNLYAISVQNEPDFLPDYESCGYSGAQMDAWIAQEGGKINTRLMMPESDSYNLDESDPTLDDSNAVGHVSIVAGHTYGVAPFYYTNAKNKGKDVWMTETTYTPAAGSSAQPTISDAIAAAELYHQSMAVAQYNAYVYWWTPLLLNGNSPNYYAYALGQYSKFVRPGYVMNGANNNPTSGVYVTSYSGSGKYVIVAVNSNGGASNITFDITGATLTSVTPYQTSASNQLAQLSAVSVSNDAFTYSLPGQSITTFVGTGSSGTPSFTLSDSASSLSVTQGSSTTDTITVTDVDGFSGSVTLSASNLPSGVTAAFGTNPTTGSSVVTFTASSTAATGTSTVTISGVSGSTTASTTVALTVNAMVTSGFSLSASPSTLSITQGASGTDTITVKDIGTFTGSVSFAASNLPSGVTASFNPTSSTSSSVLTLTASSSATIGGFTVTITGTSGSTTATTSVALSVSSSGGGSTPVYIDAGGAASGSWAADEDFSGGTALTYTNAVTTSLLTGTVPPQTVLQSQRYGSFTYTIPGYTSGSSHTVTLYFVENYVTGAGQREFNVLINGTQVLTNYDVYAAAGGQFIAVQKSFTATANSSGQIVIQFSSGAIQSPMVSGIALDQPSSGGSTPVYIDAGGAASGSWAADEDFSGGTAYTYTNAVTTSLLSGTVPPQTVLQSQRYGSFTYTIPGYTSGSSHTVTLYFVENYVTATGQREFNVLINGTQVLTNYDVYAAAGGQFKAVEKSFSTTANSSGQIVIQFSPGAIQNPMVSGIVIQ
jgi:glucuronoarabinoxylan endo-1,4-beta-xylanase